MVIDKKHRPEPPAASKLSQKCASLLANFLGLLSDVDKAEARYQ